MQETEKRNKELLEEVEKLKRQGKILKARRKFGLDTVFMNDLRNKLEYKEHKKKREALPKDGTFRITSHRDSIANITQM